MFLLLQVTTLPGLVALCFAEEEIFCLYFVTQPHVTTWLVGHVTLWVSSLYYKSPSCKVSGHKRCSRESILFLFCHVTSRD